MKENLEKNYTEDPFDYEAVEEVLERYQDEKGALIPILQAIQEALMDICLTRHWNMLARQLKTPLSKIFGVYFLCPVSFNTAR